MDWNRDGKIDVQDYVLYREVISSEGTRNSVPIGSGTSTKKNTYLSLEDTNPLISEAMFRQRINVNLKSGPAELQKYIKPRHLLQLMIDNVRKKLLIVYGFKNIIHEIDFDDIVSAVCLDAHQKRENRFRVQVVTKKNGVYNFHVDIPYNNDPNPFLSSLNYQIDCYLHPEAHEHDALYGTIALAVIAVAVLLIIIL